jgi:phage gp36-like protein
MAIFNFHGNPNGELTGAKGDAGFDVDTTPNNYFVSLGGTTWQAFNTSGNPSGDWGGLVPSPPAPSPCVSGILIPGYGGNPAPQILIAYGYDPEAYISTAKLIPQSYTTKDVVKSKIGGLIRLIESCDDASPPLGEFSGDVEATFDAVVQNATEEINGYLSTIYPMPLAQTGTVAIIQVRDVDSNGAVTEIAVIESGNYQVAPDSNQYPAYLRYVNPLTTVQNCYTGNEDFCNTWNWADIYQQKGSGLNLAVTYTTQNYSDESGQLLDANTVSGTPSIVSGGSDYVVGQLVVLQGGSSFVPAKVRQACADIVTYSLMQRRLAPDEKNNFTKNAECWRTLLVEISEGEKTLDGTYKRSFSPVSAWTQKSVLFNANSL